jgi:3-hydroxybutyryl-CoA dehydrogenase
VSKVLIVGPGTIGASLALACAVHGHATTLMGRSAESLKSAKKLISRHAYDLEQAGLMPGRCIGWEGRVATAVGLRDVPADFDIAVEAIHEDLLAKQRLLAQLEAHLHDHAILASSTSGLPVDSMVANCRHPSHFAVAHFANPPHLMPVVELVPGTRTSSDTMEILKAFVGSLGKTAVCLERDVPGHLFNRIQFAMLREAMALVDRGIATPEQVDRVVKRGIALRLAEEGPLEKIDLASVQLVYKVASYLFPLLDDSDTPTLLASMLAQGKSGATAGQGFYSWNEAKRKRVLARRNAEVIRHLQRLKQDE